MDILTCPKCGEGVSGEAFVLENKIFHASCFKCVRCAQRLNTAMYGRGGEYFCKSHWEEGSEPQVYQRGPRRTIGDIPTHKDSNRNLIHSAGNLIHSAGNLIHSTGNLFPSSGGGDLNSNDQLRTWKHHQLEKEKGVFIGDVVVPLSSFSNENIRPWRISRDVDYEKKKMEKEIRVSSPETKKKYEKKYLLITIVSAQNLRPPEEKNILPNPYVQVFIQKKDKSLGAPHRSETVFATLTPYWDYQVKIELKEHHKDLIFEVWDDRKTKYDWLGDHVVKDFQLLPPKYDGPLELGSRWKTTKNPEQTLKQTSNPMGELRVSWRIVSESGEQAQHYNRRKKSQFVGRIVPGIPPKRSERIAIVGAGPAGIHFALLLKKRGFGDVTILERDNRIGGKSYTRYIGDVPHELGTCFLHPLYFELDKLLQEYGLTEITPGGPDTQGRDIYVNLPEFGWTSEKPIDREEYVYTYAEKTALPGYWFKPELLIKGAFFKAIARYKAIHRKIFGRYDYTLPPKPPTQMMEKFSMTLGEFLKKYDCEALVPLFQIGLTVQGYGLLETVPAFYGLWWFKPELFYAYLPPPIGKNPRGTPLITMVKEGFSTIWQTIYEKEKLNILLDFDVTKIDRGSSDKVTIEGLHKEKPQTMEFDYVITTTPLKKLLKIFTEPTEMEKEIFSKLIKFKLCTTLYESALQEGTQVIEYHPGVLHPSYPGVVYAQRHSERCIHPHRQPDHHLYIAYQFLDSDVKLDDGALEKLFYGSLNDRGVKNVHVIERKNWDYFYHFDQEGISAGYPWQILEMQGTNRTMYAGSSTCFESVNDVLNYNIMLLNRFLG